jgi:hypothetical protein
MSGPKFGLQLELNVRFRPMPPVWSSKYDIVIKMLRVSNLLEYPLIKHRWAGRQQGIMVIGVVSGQAIEKNQ